MFSPGPFHMLGYCTGKADRECEQRSVMSEQEYSDYADHLVEGCRIPYGMTVSSSARQWVVGYRHGADPDLDEEVHDGYRRCGLK